MPNANNGMKKNGSNSTRNNAINVNNNSKQTTSNRTINNKTNTNSNKTNTNNNKRNTNLNYSKNDEEIEKRLKRYSGFRREAAKFAMSVHPTQRELFGKRLKMTFQGGSAFLLMGLIGFGLASALAIK